MNQSAREFLYGMSLGAVGNGIKFNSYPQYLGEKFNVNMVTLGLLAFIFILLGSYVIAINALYSQSSPAFIILAGLILAANVVLPAKFLNKYKP